MFLSFWNCSAGDINFSFMRQMIFFSIGGINKLFFTAADYSFHSKIDKFVQKKAFLTEINH
jgi:hypothetical protein